MIDWKRKLTSRKLWAALAGLVSGLIAAFGGSEEMATQIAGLIMATASVVAYVIGEGLVDAANAGKANGGGDETEPVLIGEE